ncbi:MAG: DUF2911 domain-containing protein [Saprospiraceae bacterium]|nr:DUF2911 domain-containing protein [Saprospiraceae bacterium]
MRSIFILLAFFYCVLDGNAQLVNAPSGDNQICEVTQYLGSIANVSVKYSSPGVKGRSGKIWGSLVPWGMEANNIGSAKEIPWRAGANENTVITFSHDMMVNGNPIPAGKYGFHVIPQKDMPWTLIFNKTHSAWGSYSYDANDDVMRVEVQPIQGEFTEWLTYTFTDRKPESTVLELRWETLAIPMNIALPNSNAIYVSKFKEDLKGGKGFYWQNYVEAVNFCVSNNTHLDQALIWAESAISGTFIGQKNFTTLSAKASVLEKLGRTKDAENLMDEAIKHPTADVIQIHGYGRQLLNSGMKGKALTIFEYNYKHHGGDWPSPAGMVRGLSANGKYKEALEFAEKALLIAPDETNKTFLKTAIEKLKQGKDMN